MLQSRLILLTALCLPTFIFAQVGIGVSNPDVSAKLEVSATDKGILIPRVALTATNTAGPISSPATGLLVYNTAAINGVTPGFYYWDGTVWVRLITPSDNVANVTGTVAVANGGTGATTAAGAISNLGVIASSEKGANNGVATLGSDGKVPSNQIPSVSFQSANVVASQSAMLTLSTAVAGSIAIRTDVSKNFVLSATPASTLGNWIELAVPTSVTSVNGNSGPSVSLTPGSLGATTLGNNLFTLSDPGAVTFPRFNANNTVSALNAADFRTAIGAGTGSGTVTSVGLSLPNIFSVTNSPVTGSGTLTGALATQNANRVFAGPTTGSAAAPTFRSLVAADIPTLNQNTTGTASNVTGIVAVANGGTGLSSLSTGITTFLGSASSANLASALTDETGSAGSLVFSSNPTFQTITVASGSSQYPSSIAITPTMHASSKRAAVWVDGWSLLQDVQGNGTKDFSIGQTTGTPATYPSRLYINTSGNIGIGNTQPNARLDIRTSPTNTSDPGAGYFGVGTTSAAANTAGAGAVRYSTASGGTLEFSNGTDWYTLTSNVQKAIVVAKKTTALSVAHNTTTDVTGWDEITDATNNFNPTTGAFTAPRAGNYVVSFSYSFTSGSITAGSWAEAMLISSSGPTNDKKSVSSFPASSTTTVAGASITFTLRLNAGEIVIPKIWHNLGVTRDLRVGTGANDGFVNFSVAEL